MSLKLNLGCGNLPLKGWKNIDKFYFPASAELHPDRGKPEDYDWEQGDFIDLSKFKDNSIDQINMAHSLEHTYWEGAKEALLECYRVLKPNCKIEIEVPDMNAVFDKRFDYQTMVELVWGGLGKGTLTFGHNIGFTKKMLYEFMTKAGFKNIKEIPVGFGSSKPEPEKNFRFEGEKC